MKPFNYLFIALLFCLHSYAQISDDFKTVEKRISNIFFQAPEKAKSDAYLLKEIAKTNEEKQIAYKFLSYVYDLTGKEDSARFYLNKRLNFAKKHFNKQLPYYESVISYVNWGLDYIASDILIEKLTSALNTMEYEEFQQQKGLMYMLMGDILLRENDLDNASAYFDKSFKLIKSKYAPIDYYLRKGKISILKNDYINAENFLHKGLSIDEATTTYTYPNFLNMLGYISIMQGKLVKARSYLNKSLRYQEKNNFKTFTAKTYLNLALLAREENSNTEKELLDKALEYSKNEPIVTKDIYLAYKGFYERNKQLKQEQIYLKKFTSLNNSIFNSEKAKIKLDLESRYKLNESEKEIKYKEQIIQDDKKIKKLYSVALILLLLLFITLIIVFRTKIKAHNKNRKIQKLLHDEQLKSTLENQRIEIIKEKIKAQAEERERLSLELHDGIASEISALKLSLSNPKNATNPLINSTINKIDQLYHEVRNLSHNLNPDSVTEIAFTQLVNKITDIVKNNGIQVHKNIVISTKIDDLNENTLLNLYRILQELINNLVKHSKATRATIEVLENNKSILLEVSDNGIGIDNKHKFGIGLKNIQKRVSVLNGTIIISSVKGTKVSISIPL
ncbi:ATP-binding protein [Pseudofulvibacter geojedonensis]|uniref:histidine kinase n=1 Tax=Pseudofulvibacter geojedonensis TaxID=1123758 RepID=A0ABW3I4V8_9FLAO